MKIAFKKLQMHNFMSFADETIDFSRYSGMNLIQGKNNDIPNARNGVGKT